MWLSEPVLADVLSVRTVVRDGWYNMPTDLAWWKGYYWLSYRRGTGHSCVRGNSAVVLLCSNDLRRWNRAHIFEPPESIVDGRGIAAGHFTQTDDTLYLFCPVQWPGESGVPSRIFMYWTSNGLDWSAPQVLCLDNDYPYTWRVRSHDDRFYAAICYLEDDEGPFDLIVSDDAVHWTRHAQIAAANPNHFTEESDLHWRPDGELWCVVRSHGPALMYWSEPPYTTWEGGVNLGGRCDAPVICASGKRVYLAGRVAAPGNPHGTAGVYQLTRGRADLILSMPAGGDSAYPGLISLEPGRMAMSFYSDVAYWSGLVKPRHFEAYQRKRSECDIYLAEFALGV
jgi:hypothetical protein